MHFLPIAFLAYFLIALNLTLDKIILKKALPSPVVYCFYVGLMSIFGVVFAPFGRFWFGPEAALAGILVGAVFMAAIYLMYKALFSCEASRVGPIIGALTPIFVAFFSFFILGEVLNGRSFLAFLLLVVGGLAIAIDFRDKESFDFRSRRNQKLFRNVILSALIFGLYYVLLKSVFNEQNFIAGLVWTRVGAFLATFLLLIPARNRRLIFQKTKKTGIASGGLVILNKTMSGIAFALLNYAISLGNVAIVNAMQGLQYIFLLFLVVLFSKFYPKILNEETDKFALFQKGFAVILIFSGLFMIGFVH